jgi:hypothetical protein
MHENPWVLRILMNENAPRQRRNWKNAIERAREERITSHCGQARTY